MRRSPILILFLLPLSTLFGARLYAQAVPGPVPVSGTGAISSLAASRVGVAAAVHGAVQITTPGQVGRVAESGQPVYLGDQVTTDEKGKLHSVDLGRLLVSVPYTFRGAGNKQGGRLGDWSVDLETYPTSRMRLETDWTYQAVPPQGSDTPTSLYNLDLVMVGGTEKAEAKYAPGIQAPSYRAFEVGEQPVASLMPKGQWYLGLGHRYSRNDKTEDVLEYNWQVSKKWQIGTYHRFTWKEVVGGSKRFNNLREWQYRLRRDLHDWIGELVYHVDREFGEEIYFTLTLKAYPQMPIGFHDSYHEPKLGSQSSPFSPVHAN